MVVIIIPDFSTAQWLPLLHSSKKGLGSRPDPGVSQCICGCSPDTLRKHDCSVSSVLYIVPRYEYMQSLITAADPAKVGRNEQSTEEWLTDPNRIKFWP